MAGEIRRQRTCVDMIHMSSTSVKRLVEDFFQPVGGRKVVLALRVTSAAHEDTSTPTRQNPCDTGDLGVLGGPIYIG
jgi:hypothetical protein